MATKFTTYLLPPRSLYSDYWSTVCRIYGAAILDRTNSTDFGFKYRTLTPIPELTAFSKTFEEVCNDRVMELADLAESNDCKINLMWSGGIDSTTALTGFIKMNKTDRVNIYLNQASIDEYPLFFHEFIHKQGLNYFLVDDPKKSLTSYDINVTGEIGDQIFGSAAIMKAYENGKMLSPYQDYISSNFLEKISGNLSCCPIPLETTFDFLWWFNFSMKYQNVQLRIYPTVLLPYGSIYHFFDTKEFQLWSMNNPDKKIRDTPQSYKFTAKDYIFDLTNDAEYRDNKLKIGSLQLGGIPFAINDNFECVKVR